MKPEDKDDLKNVEKHSNIAITICCIIFVILFADKLFFGFIDP